MKTIIAATDFSEAATNAVQYAAAFAEATEARLVLFHHFAYPIQGMDLPEIYPIIAIEDIASGSENRLENLKAELARAHKIEIECIVRSLTLASDLEEVFYEEQADLLVMGIHGQNAVINALSGNETSAAIRRGNLPLLVIPQGVVFHSVQKILFPCDDREVSNSDILRPLWEVATAFDAYIEVLTLFDLEKTPELVPTGELTPAKSNLDTLLAGIRHGYAYENETAVDKGILYEATRSAADMVAMIPHRHSFWSSLFNQSDTQRIAASINLPLLVLGEKVQKEVDTTEEDDYSKS